MHEVCQRLTSTYLRACWGHRFETGFAALPHERLTRHRLNSIARGSEWFFNNWEFLLSEIQLSFVMSSVAWGLELISSSVVDCTSEMGTNRVYFLFGWVDAMDGETMVVLPRLDSTWLRLDLSRFSGQVRFESRDFDSTFNLSRLQVRWAIMYWISVLGIIKPLTI